MSLPVVKTFADCADFHKTVLPYVPQLYDLPQQVFQNINNLQALKVLYISTNPLITALAFSLFLAPIFLIVSEVNKNYSQVDRCWSILPTVYNAHFVLYAHAAGLPTKRLDILMLFSGVWSARLTYNYWRKGGYNIGSEDYRWEVLREYIKPPLFFVFNVVFISLVQSLLLFSITTPTYVLLLAAKNTATSFPVGDIVFSRALGTLVFLAYYADGQQWNYQEAKKEYQKTAKVPQSFDQEDLDRGFNTIGIWAYSRHPNFAAEQSVWVVLYAWSCWITQTYYNWTGIGAIAYLILFQASTWFTELLSARKYPEYKEYQRRVGKFLPKLPGGAPGDFSDKKRSNIETSSEQSHLDELGLEVGTQLTAGGFPTPTYSPIMNTLLQRSRILARLPGSTINKVIYPRTSPLSISLPRSSQLEASRRRAYATSNAPDPKDSKDADANGKSVTGNEGKPGKPARGFEGLYGNAGPMSPQPSRHNVVSKLTSKDEEAVDGLLAMLTKGLPAAQLPELEAAFHDMKRTGNIPIEVREIMDTMKNKPLDLASAAKLIRLLTALTRQHGAKPTASEAQSTRNSEQEDTKSSTSSEGGKKKKKPGDTPNFKEFTANMDTGTFLTTAFVGYLLYRTVIPSENSKDITYQEFKTTFFDKGLVDKLTVLNRHRVRVDLNREATGRQYPESPAQHGNFRYYFSIGSVEAFERKLDDAHKELGIPSSERIPVEYVDEVPWLSGLLSFAPTVLFIAGLYWVSRRAGGGGAGGQSGIFGIGKSRAKKFNHEADIQIRFKDVAGMDEAKAEIMEFVSFLKEPGQYQRLGAKIPRGALLSGPPGTGKTLLAKATAGESQVPFFSISGSEFVEIFVGVGASRVRDLFQNARKNSPCIIFIDEIDAVGKARGKGGFSGGNDEREGTLNQILTEMDGFNTTEQVIVLAGTNRPDVLDKALLRPGRFDRQIAIDRPTMEGRKQIFAVHLRKIVTSEDMDHLTGRLSALTPGFSGADIANCVNEAALVAARTSADKVSMTHFEQAIERVIGGLEKKSLVLKPEEKRTVAYHEAGHAICGWFFKYADPLLKVSIIPRGQGALGYAQYLPDGESYLMNVNQLMDRMAMTLAGRVSEELHFDTVTSGASDDFNKVTRLATAMVTKWGMSSKIGYLYFDDDSQQQLHKPFSEDTARNIDMEVRRIVDEAYIQCKDLLTEKKKEVGMVAEELLSKEMLTRDDLVRILGKRPFEDNKEFSKYFEGTGGKSAPPPPPHELQGPPEGNTPDAPGGAVAMNWSRPQGPSIWR